MDGEASAMQWCPDAVDSRLYEVFYYTLEGKKRKWQGRGISTRRPWQRLAPIPWEQGKHATSREDSTRARFFLP